MPRKSRSHHIAVKHDARRKLDSTSPKRHKKSNSSLATTTASSGEQATESSSSSVVLSSSAASTATSSASTTTAINTAVSRIQRVWRSTFSHLVTRKFAIDFLKPRGRPGVTLDYVKSISFEDLVVFLRDKAVVASTKNCLHRLYALCTSRHGSPPAASGHVNVRVCLAAYMIAYRPTHVFESMGALETSLYDAACPFTLRFQRIVEECVASGAFHDVPVELTTGFLEMLHQYLECFKAWKVPDEAKLTCRIKHALIALYQAEDNLPLDEPDDSRLKIEFRTQIERLRSKLQQIAGRDVLTGFDQERSAGGVAVRVGGGRGGGAAAVYSTFPGRVTNEQLTHELLRDQTFQLDDNGGGVGIENPVFHRIRESFHKAFWDSLADDLRLIAPCYVRVLRVLCEIRDGISDLAGSRESAVIGEAIDIEFIRRQVEIGVYEWDDFKRLVGSVVGVIMRIQGPKRDIETQDLWRKLGSNMLAVNADRNIMICKALEFLLDRVNILRLDAANARIRLIAPIVRDHGIDYERCKFQDKLNDGSLTLERTEQWIRKTVSREPASMVDNLVAGKADAFVSLHTTAIFSLVTDLESTITPETIPETLIFDAHRLLQIQHEYNCIVDRATVLTIATHHIIGSDKTPSAEKRKVIADLVHRMVVVTGEVFDPVELCRDLDLAGLLTDEASRGKLLKALTLSAEKKDDAVRQLIASRIRSVWLDYMHTLTPVVDTKFIAPARSLIPSIEAAALKLIGVANMNRAIHTPTYNRLIAEAVVVEEVD